MGPCKTIAIKLEKAKIYLISSNWNNIIMLYFIFLCLFCLLPQGTYGIKCYQCEGNDNKCDVGLLGVKEDCPSSTTSCYKSWTVESSPITKRKCADERVYDDVCSDVLEGQMSMVACYCGTDFCNSATSASAAILITMLSLVIFIIIQW